MLRGCCNLRRSQSEASLRCHKFQSKHRKKGQRQQTRLAIGTPMHTRTHTHIKTYNITLNAWAKNFLLHTFWRAAHRARERLRHAHILAIKLSFIFLYALARIFTAPQTISTYSRMCFFVCVGVWDCVWLFACHDFNIHARLYLPRSALPSCNSEQILSITFDISPSLAHTLHSHRSVITCMFGDRL